MAKKPAIPDQVRIVLQRAGIARSRDLERDGISRTQLRRLVEREVVERVSRGLYRLPGAALTERQHFMEAALRVPGGVLCLLSALRFHGLTTQNPFEIWMAIGRKAWRPRIEHPPLRLFYLSSPALEARERKSTRSSASGCASSARPRPSQTASSFATKIGIDVAVEALRDYRRLFPKQLEAVWRFAEVDRVTQVIRPYLEAGA